MLVPDDQVFQNVRVKVIESGDQLHLVPAAASPDQIRGHGIHACLLLLLLKQEMDPVTILSAWRDVAGLVFGLPAPSPEDQEDEQDQQEQERRRRNDGKEIEITRRAASSGLGRGVSVLLPFLLIHIYIHREDGRREENVSQINISSVLRLMQQALCITEICLPVNA